MSDTTSTSPESMESSSSVTLVIKACDMCRKKKIKCEPTGQTCVQCIRYKTLCHFTPISTKRAARKPAGHKRVEELEKRLKSMEESLKRATAKLQQPQANGQPNQGLVRSQISMPVLPDEVGSPSFLGHMIEDFPMDLAVNIPWDEALPQDLNMNYSYGALIPAHSRPSSVPIWNDRPMTDMFARKIFKPLPPKEEMIELISISLQSFNEAFPLFDQEFFIEKLRDLENSIQDPAFWAALNVILAMANRFRVGMNTEADVNQGETWKYFQNALSVVNQLTLLPPSLLSTQALIGMAIVIQGTPSSAPYAFLNNTAMKMAQQLDLHRAVRDQDSTLSAAEVERRKRVFWIAYFIDKDISLRTGHPPVQDDDEMDVELPEYCTNEANSASGNIFFRLRINLALIQGKIYKQLLSVRASKQSVAERVTAVRRLEASLQSWKASVPPEYQQEYHTMLPHWNLKEMTPVIHSVILRLTFFHALSAVHRFSTPVNDWQNLMEAPVGHDPDMVHEPPAPITTIEEARKALKLLLVTPQGDFACIWVVLHIFVSATTTLLTHILANPLHPLAQSDLQLIEPLLSLLGLLSMQGKNLEVEGMYESCRTMWERTRRAVWEAKGSGFPANTSPITLMPVPMISQGKSVEDKESLEDFIRRIENIAGGSEVDAFEYDFLN